jgi:hypothetical protein
VPEEFLLPALFYFFSEKGAAMKSVIKKDEKGTNEIDTVIGG